MNKSFFLKTVILGKKRGYDELAGGVLIPRVVYRRCGDGISEKRIPGEKEGRR